MREVMLPDVKSFGELFNEFRPWIHGKDSSMVRNTGPERIGNYCGVRGVNGMYSLYVIPNPSLLQRSLEWSRHVELFMSWQVTVRANGTALISLEYQQIIGSIWIALVDAATIPADTE